MGSTKYNKADRLTGKAGFTSKGAPGGEPPPAEILSSTIKPTPEKILGVLPEIDLNDLPALGREIMRTKAELFKKDFYSFIQEFWDVVVVEKPVWNWHIKVIADILQHVGERVSKRLPKESDVIINLPPGLSKSTICSILYPVWCWVLDPTITMITASHDQSLSNRLTNKSRELIKSDKFQAYFPHIKMGQSQDNKEDYENTFGGYRIATSSKSSPTGRHALLLITDDIQNPVSANSEIERNNVNSYITDTLGTRKSNKDVSVTVYVSQRLHPQDNTGNLLEKGKNYTHICLPAELGDNVKPVEHAAKYVNGLLDPIRLSHKTLDEMRTDLGTKTVETQMNQKPDNEEDAVIKEKWMDVIEPVEFEKLLNEKTVVEFFADTAYTDKTENDPSALLACIKIGERLYITNVTAVRKEFPQLIEYLGNWTQAAGYSARSKITVEPKASGQSIVQLLRLHSNLNIKEGEAPKSSKIERLHAIAPIVECGKVAIVRGPWNVAFMDEITASSPKHDDRRDVFVMAIENLLVKKRATGKYYLGVGTFGDDYTND